MMTIALFAAAIVAGYFNPLAGLAFGAIALASLFADRRWLGKAQRSRYAPIVSGLDVLAVIVVAVVIAAIIWSGGK